MANNVEVKELLEAGVHFGHLTRRWNPNMAPYIYMERNGIHIINLYKSAAKMQEAADALAKIAASGRKILFVATKKQAKEIVAREALKANMPFITERWMGGMLTNFVTIRKAVKKMDSVDRMKKDGSFDTLSKKEKLQVERMRAKLEKNLGSISEMSRLPGALFVVDTTREHIAIKEAQKLNIPIFAMVDTNSDPRKVDYVIPSNDDASKSISKVVSFMADAIVEGLSDRKTEKDTKKDIKKDTKKEEKPESKKPLKSKTAAHAKAAPEIPSTDEDDVKAMKEAKNEVVLESKEETMEEAGYGKKDTNEEK